MILLVEFSVDSAENYVNNYGMDDIKTDFLFLFQDSSAIKSISDTIMLVLFNLTQPID